MTRGICAALLVLTVAGCSSSGAGPSGSSAASSTTSGADMTAVYLQVIRDYLPGKSDSELLALGHGICREFDDGKTWTDIVAGLVNGGTPAKTSGGIVAVAVASLCPVHKADLPAS